MSMSLFARALPARGASCPAAAEAEEPFSRTRGAAGVHTCTHTPSIQVRRATRVVDGERTNMRATST